MHGQPHIRFTPYSQLLKQFQATFLYLFPTLFVWGRDSAVGTATLYGLDGPRIEFGEGGGVLGFIQPPIQRIPGPSPGKSAGAWR